MTTRVVVTSLFDLPLEEWVGFMSDPGLHRYLTTLPGITRRRLCNLRQTGTVRTWDVELAVREQIPRAVRSLVPGDGLNWVQRFSIDMSIGSLEFRIDHPFPRQLAEITGHGQISSTGPRQCALELEVVITSRVPMLAGRIEAFVADMVKRKLDEDSQFRRDYVLAHPDQILPPITIDAEGRPCVPGPDGTPMLLESLLEAACRPPSPRESV